MCLDGVQVVLVETGISENVGMVARACANTGCRSLCLVAPRDVDMGRAGALATPQGRPILDAARVVPDLPAAVAASSLVIGTTARKGGWRRDILSPGDAAGLVADALARGDEVSLVFGPEDRGLSNRDVTLCTHLASIPTAPGGTSLNVAQAALILLYGCGPGLPASSPRPGGARTVPSEDMERLMARLGAMFREIDLVHGDDPDYYLLLWRRLFARAGLRRHEYDALMGLCRQVGNRIGARSDRRPRPPHAP
ncbi:MAG: RNA methyltransferase [Desulfovibrio sp.]|jgi:tRNA/rRNA methyltransferase|nr:RNA methyltransferase [Desulfovibrio sp.]